MRAQQSRSDRGVTEHDDHRQGHRRLEKDLERAAGQARVVYGHHAILVGPTGIIRTKIIRRRRDTYQPWLPGRQRLQRLGAHRRLRAIAADEPVDLAVGEHERRVARLGTGRPLRPDDGRPHEGRAARGERRSPRGKV